MNIFYFIVIFCEHALAPSTPRQMATNTAAGSAGVFFQLIKGNFPHPVEVSAENQ